MAFAPPPLWHWPPFFTLQPNEASRATQLEEWGKLLLAYCEHHRRSVLPVLKDWELWENAALGRSMSPEGMAAVAEQLVARKRAEWVDGASSRASLRIFWRTPAEWSTIILEHMQSSGEMGKMFIVAELQSSGEVCLLAPWQGLELATFYMALELLHAQGKLQLRPAASGLPQEASVKFVKV